MLFDLIELGAFLSMSGVDARCLFVQRAGVVVLSGLLFVLNGFQEFLESIGCRVALNSLHSFLIACEGVPSHAQFASCASMFFIILKCFECF